MLSEMEKISGKRLESKHYLCSTKFDDFICLYTARIRMKFEYLCEVTEVLEYPLLTLLMRAVYLIHPELLDGEGMEQRDREFSSLIVHNGP